MDLHQDGCVGSNVINAENVFYRRRQQVSEERYQETLRRYYEWVPKSALEAAEKLERISSLSLELVTEFRNVDR